jgi:hypothetical protein
MNKNLPEIRNHQELMAERAHLETLIENQKNIIRHDLDELKAEFKKEIRPAIDAANVVKKFARPETRTNAIIATGTGFLIDLVLKRAFRKSNIVVQLLIPRMLKNYTSHLIHRISSHSSVTLPKNTNTFRPT